MDAASLCRLVRATGGGRTTEEMRPDGRVGARCAYTPYSLRAASATLLFERRCRHPQGARYGGHRTITALLTPTSVAALRPGGPATTYRSGNWDNRHEHRFDKKRLSVTL
jgi:hypothetical protein